MKVEMKVDWGALPKEPRVEREPRVAGPEIPRSRAERRLWYIAVAREIESMVGDGRLASMADAANRCGVSRARVCNQVKEELNWEE